MIFNSLVFLVFLPVVLALYWIPLRNRVDLQNLLLLVASFVFYGWWDWRFLGLILLSGIIDFLVGLQLASVTSARRRKLLLIGSILVNLGILGFFKYFNFFVSSAALALESIGFQANVSTLNIILPVGISFYTFQSMSYSIDVYRGRLKPTSDPIRFLAYIAFFPQLVAGPIERAKNLLPQFSRRRELDMKGFSEAINQIAWGFFKKLVIADNCAVHVDEIFSNAGSVDTATLWLGALYFAFQIYGDFSGYSDIAIGTAKLFGFDLMRNFNYPYFSRDIAEFWRRWHISLSSWFRDYLYIPLGGSRGSRVLNIRNVFIVFVVSGFWHGANFTFLVWGLLHALFFLPQIMNGSNRRTAGSTVAENAMLPSPVEFLQILRTFVLCLLAWVVFRADSLSEAGRYIQGMFSGLPNFAGNPYLDIAPLIVLLLMVEWPSRARNHPLKVGDRLGLANQLTLFCTFWLIMVWGNFGNQQFIYFQF